MLDQTRWGPWRLDAETRELVTERTAGDIYPVDLDRCLTAAQTLDWVAQVAAKTWATPTVVAGLVRALDDVLHLQGNLCPSGRPRTLTRASVESLTARAARRGAPLSTGGS